MGNVSNNKSISHSRSPSGDESSSKPKHERKLSRKYSQIFQRRKSLLSSSKTNNGCGSGNNNNIESCESFNRLKQILTYYYKYIEEFNTCYQPRYSLISQHSIPNGHEAMDTVGIPASLLELTTKMSMPELEAPQMKTQIQEILAADAERKENINNLNREGLFEYLNNKFEKGSYSNIKLLNDFNHCLFQHSQDDDLFEEQYNILISLICKECDINSCLILRRNYRNRINIFDDKRNEIYFGFNSSKEINIQQILDKIHCFYYHSYDLGFKLNTNLGIKLKENNSKKAVDIYQFLEEDLNENEEIDDAKIPHSPKGKNINDNEIEFENKNIELLSLRDILLNKMKKNVSIRSHLRFKKDNNRYFSNNDAISNINNPRYYYWQYYKNKQDVDKHNEAYKYCDWYIPTRFQSLKDELLNNGLNICHYNDLYEKSLNYIETDEIKKKLLCNVSIWESSYNILIGTLISVQQLIAIILYTSFDSLRRKFIKTFYYINKSETKKSLIKRHCHYANFGRLLREICECFGVQTKNSKINKFYHSITYNVWINSVSVIIKYPFSTSLNNQTILNYILSFNNINNGLLLKLNGDPSGYSTYFNCNFLSDFPNENEILFVGGLWPLIYKNVISINNGYNLKIYLYAIHIIDQMLNGIYYKLDINQIYLNKIQNIVIKLINHQLYKIYNNNNDKQQNKQEEEEEDFIDEEEEIAKRQKIQKIARRPSAKVLKRSSFNPPQKALPSLPVHLQNNIIGKNDNSGSDSDENENEKKKNESSKNLKMKNKYKKFENIPQYIDNIMDRYCNKLLDIKLDYMRMNKEKSKSMPEYRGYKFCGDLFCLYKIEWFKLPIILKLFPNLNCISIYGNIELNVKILDYILIILVNEINQIIKKYNISKTNLKKANKLLKLKTIEIDEPDEYTLTIKKAIKKYTNKFKKIQWKMYEDDQQLIITSNDIIQEEEEEQNQYEND